MEKTVADDLELFTFMKSLDFFGKLSKKALWPLVDLCTLRHYETNELLITEGSPPVGVFILRKGKVQIFKTLNDKSELVITTLKEGEIIGEISVIDKLETTTSVRALEPVECIFISEWDFTTQIHAYPEIGLELLPILASRIRIMYEKMK